MPPSGDDALKTIGRKACDPLLAGVWKKHYGREGITVVTPTHSLAFRGFNYPQSTAVQIY